MDNTSERLALASEAGQAAVKRSPFVPVVWAGKAEGADPASADTKTQTEDEPPRLKPNVTFLNNCVRQAVVGNQREIAHNSTKAACQALGSAARPELARMTPKGDAAVRRMALSLARTQKLAACTALLREVAVEYGFSLRIDVPDEWAGAEDEPAVPSAEGDAAQAAVSHAASPAVSSQACPPSRAHVQLQALAASLDELDEVQAAGAQLVSQAATSPEGKDPARRGRLANAALAALGQPQATRITPTAAQADQDSRGPDEALVQADEAAEDGSITVQDGELEGEEDNEEAMLFSEEEGAGSLHEDGSDVDLPAENGDQPVERQLPGLHSDKWKGANGKAGGLQSRLVPSEAVQSTAKRKVTSDAYDASKNDALTKHPRLQHVDEELRNSNDVAPAVSVQASLTRLAKQTQQHDNAHAALLHPHEGFVPEARASRPAGLFAAALASASRQAR